MATAEDSEREYGIAANVMSDTVLREGARVWINQVGGTTESAFVRGLSKGGRAIEKWIPLKRLSNFRAKWVPEGEREQVWLVIPKVEAARRASMYEKANGDNVPG